ncbi:ROK family protein [Agarilytica rhodophyticola]|uniref:ROK family protein n=1 Tax=Agarilytica rhodophyticola TaxID=1737490 RepID=UPI000B34308C|nr:ROK family protein [Agarilytica rhodophyticola]
MFGAVEAGGTKFICAVGPSPDKLLAKVSFPTTSPQETLAKVNEFFLQQIEENGALRAIGLGSFGPINISRQSADFGKLAATPKKGWAGFDIVKAISKTVNTDVALETDVNCALLGEAAFGSGKGVEDLAYITIGTGIGGGLMNKGRLIQGYSHPEIGHMLAVRHPDDQDFPGICAFHGGQCFEGLASGPAIEKRWACKAVELDKNHKAWKIQGYYIAALCMNLLLSVTPKRIILGGGVMNQRQLFPIIREELTSLLAGYIDLASNNLNLQEVIVPAGLDGEGALQGAILLAKQYVDENVSHQQSG